VQQAIDFRKRVSPSLKGLLQGAAFSLLTLAVFLISAHPLQAQASAGIVGTVTDISGGVIPDAKVSISSNDTSVTQQVTTSGAGTYALSGLTPGRYTVTVESPGFKKAIQEKVLIEVGTQATINLSLSPGAASETVQVIASSVALNTTQPQLGTTI